MTCQIGSLQVALKSKIFLRAFRHSQPTPQDGRPAPGTEKQLKWLNEKEETERHIENLREQVITWEIRENRARQLAEKALRLHFMTLTPEQKQVYRKKEKKKQLRAGEKMRRRKEATLVERAKTM